MNESTIIILVLVALVTLVYMLIKFAYKNIKRARALDKEIAEIEKDLEKRGLL